MCENLGGTKVSKVPLQFYYPLISHLKHVRLFPSGYSILILSADFVRLFPSGYSILILSDDFERLFPSGYSILILSDDFVRLFPSGYSILILSDDFVKNILDVQDLRLMTVFQFAALNLSPDILRWSISSVI